MNFLLADGLTIDPSKIAEDLSKAQDVQQVLSTIVGVLLFFLIVVVVWYVKREREHEKSRVATQLTHAGALENAEKRVDKAYDDVKETYSTINDMLAGKLKESQ